jgi:hypothetical protein
LRLHSPAFEKALRRGVRAAVRSSPELKREFRKANKFRRQLRAAGFLRVCFSFTLAAAVGFTADTTRHAATALAVIGLWTLALVLATARNLLVSLFRANDLGTLLLLPVSESTIFRWELQKFFRGSLFCLGDLIVGFGALGLFLKLRPLAWIWVPALAALSWAVLLALAALCAAQRPRFPYGKVRAGLILIGLVLFLAWRVMGPFLLTVLDPAAPALNLLLPTGWGPSLFQLASPDRHWTTLGLIVPIGLILCTVRNSLGLLRRRYQFHEVTAAPAPDLIPGADSVTVAPPAGGIPSAPMRAGLTAIEEIVQSRQFLSPEPRPRKGRFEQWLWQWFNPRERTLAEFAYPNGFAITRPWWLILRNFLCMAVLGFAAGLAGQQAELWTFGIGFFVILVHAATQVLGNGAAFQTRFNNGVNIPVYAGFPIGFRELSQVLFKCCLIQLPLLIPFTMLCAGLMAHLAGAGFAFGILPGFKAAFLICASRFILVALAFSSGTNDSTGLHFRTLVLVVVVVGLGLLFLILGAAGLLVPNPLTAWSLWALALCDSYALFRMYGWFYHAYRFDLMKIQGR